MNKKLGFLTLAVALTVGAGPVPDASLGPHFGLDRSSPSADASVTSLEEVRLWFTQAPEQNSVSIRLIDEAGNALETGELMTDAGDDTTFSVSLASDLLEGTYTVSWRGIGDDGHVARGDFAFTVATQ